jgi:microcin C transport system ATP-binding protein
MNAGQSDRIRDLSVEFFTGEQHQPWWKISASISAAAKPWHWWAKVGSGKSVTAHSILRLLPYPRRGTTGTIKYAGQDLLTPEKSPCARFAATASR